MWCFLKLINKKNNTYILLYLCNLLLISPCLIFGGSNFTNDSYIILNDGANVHISSSIGNFRYFGAFIYKILSLLNHNPILNSTLDIIFYVILVPAILSLVLTEFKKCLETDDIISLAAIDVCVLLSIYNIWFCNILSFPECIVITAIGITLCFSSLIILIHSKNILYYIFSAILLVLSTAVYQQFISVFAIFAIAYCGIYTVKNQDKKLIIFNYVMITQ